ncbi:hypothetical protein CLD22_21100 [Rubrivivax gelatinosus]|nr:hypothetical protein [Rubrivivax gelatinosus]
MCTGARRERPQRSRHALQSRLRRDQRLAPAPISPRRHAAVMDLPRSHATIDDDRNVLRRQLGRPSSRHTDLETRHFMSIEARLHRAHGALTTLHNGRHAWTADLPQALGSDDLAPDPHDLLDSALAACTVLTLELYIRRKQLPVTGLRVSVEHLEEKIEGQVHYQLQRRLFIEGDIAPADRQRLLEIAGKCPIHRVLEGEVAIHTELGS